MNSKQLLSSAQAGHGNDKANLLAAINEAAQGLKGGSGAQAQGHRMMQASGVDQRLARELTSQTQGQADLSDFGQARPLTKTLLANKDLGPRGEHSDTRSCASEFDYGSKKKFTDVLGNTNNRNAQIRKMQQMMEDQRSANGSQYSRASRGSKMSSVGSQILRNRMGASPMAGRISPIQEQVELENMEQEMVDLDAFNKCSVTGQSLNEDERIINYRLMKQALENGHDISAFPLCAKEISNLLSGNMKDRNDKYEELLKSGAPEKLGFFPSNKKMYDFNQFQNSEEFKQLGTLAAENRHMNYYPAGSKDSPGAAVGKKKLNLQAGGEQLLRAQRGHGLTHADLANAEPGDALEQELRKLSSQRGADSVVGFPQTTNQEFLDETSQTTKVTHDKANFKKKNPFMAYVDSSFNSGVFTHPWRDIY